MTLKNFCVLFFFLATSVLIAGAQNSNAINQCTLKDGGIQITFSKKQSPATLDSFIKKNNLSDLHIDEYFKKASLDTLLSKGWKIIKTTDEEVVVFKPFYSLGGISEPQNKIAFADKGEPGIDFDKLSREAAFGYNHFNNKYPFAVKGSAVTFYLRGYTKAKTVFLPGSFNNWSTTERPMIKTDSGWIVNIMLSPGKYWYKFIVDGNWMEDPDNAKKEPNEYDGFNSVYYFCNFTFRLDSLLSAKKVYLSGSFNDWKENELRMDKTNRGWEFPVFIKDATYTYKFLVDGKWVTDPSNPNKVNDGSGGYNSVLSRGTPYLFKLKGFLSAKDVVLSGTFNNWQENEMHMKRVTEGWELPYVLSPGNYEYKFIVDRKWITDPDNPYTIMNEEQSGNSILVISPNHTFRLKGYTSAKEVLISGDFNNWNPNGFPMSRTADGWIYSLYLSPGKHTYKFIVDGAWILDPGNKLWENNEFNTGNSVIWVEKSNP